MKRLFHFLSDGHLHSGEALGQSMGLTRAAVCKQVRKLETLGVAVRSVRGKGYRLLHPMEPLNRALLLSHMKTFSEWDILELFQEIDSTNAYLLRRSESAPGRIICLAESQSAGKGRRGRSWYSPYGSNLYLSVLWPVKAGLQALDGLSLVVGVSVARALEHLGIEGMQLKWPNDLFYNDRKLGGILIELSGHLMDSLQLVIGIGLNLKLPPFLINKVDQPVTDLAEAFGWSGSRNQLAAAVIDQLLMDLVVFEREGFAPFREFWQRRNAFKGRQIQVHGPEGMYEALCLGVNERGELLVYSAGGQRCAIRSGDVSLKLSPSG